MSRFILSNARIITPTQHFTGSLVIEEQVIAEVLPGKSFAEGVDLQGRWLAPGCIDIHSDYLEKELHPRPSANFPLSFAFHFMDQRAAACGLTTLFSAISFSENESARRSFQAAIDQAAALDQLVHTGMIRHFIHARLDPNAPAVVQYLEPMKAIDSLRLVVVNESIPGQRQFRIEDLIVKRAQSLGISTEESEALLQAEIDQRSQVDHRPEIQNVFGGSIPLGSHDDTTLSHVEEAHRYGASLSEMPTTLEAARRAKALGMWVCMGAPNYVRGGSHCGNLSCHEAIAEDLVDMLCSDYHFPTMLASVVRMMKEGFTPSQAINLVSLHPARFLGLEKLGAIEAGKLADLVAFREEQEVAKISHVWVNGQLKFMADPEGIRLMDSTTVNP